MLAVAEVERSAVAAERVAACMVTSVVTAEAWRAAAQIAAVPEILLAFAAAARPGTADSLARRGRLDSYVPIIRYVSTD